MMGCMSQDPPPLPEPVATAHPAAQAPLPTLEYRPQPRGPAMGVGQYLLHFTAAAIVVGIVLFALLWVARMKQVFVDFGVKLPLSTQFMLDVSDASRACYGWVLLAAVPFGVPFLLARLRPAARRWVAVFAFLLTALLVLFVILAVFEPMVTLMEAISGRK